MYQKAVFLLVILDGGEESKILGKELDTVWASKQLTPTFHFLHLLGTVLPTKARDIADDLKKELAFLSGECGIVFPPVSVAKPLNSCCYYLKSVLCSCCGWRWLCKMQTEREQQCNQMPPL